MTRPKLIQALIGGGLIFLLGISLADNFAEPDFFSFINFGRQFWMEGGLPRHDIFSYLPTIQPLVLQEWLTWVLFYPVYITWGAAPLQMLKFACGLLTAWLVYRAARQRGASRAGAATGLLLVSYIWGYAFPAVLARNFSYLFFAATIALIEAHRNNQKNRLARWGPIPLFMLWANLHGGFPTGLAVLLFYVLGQAITGRSERRFWALTAACCAATLVTPYGWRLWPTVLGHGLGPDPEGLEWMALPQAVEFLGWEPHLALFVMLAAATVPLLLFYGKKNPVMWMMMGFFGGLALRSQRHIPFFILSFAVYAPAALTAWLTHARHRPPAFSARAAVIITVVFCLPPLLYNAVWFPRKIRAVQKMGSALALKIPEGTESVSYRYPYPVGAVNFIREKDLRGKILADLIWGGYLAWELFPESKVAFDTRTETTFPPLVRRRYYDYFLGRPNWEEMLRYYPPDMIITSAPGKLRQMLAVHPGWREIYADPVCALLIRRQGAGAFAEPNPIPPPR